MKIKLFILLSVLLLPFPLLAQAHHPASGINANKQAVQPVLIKPQFPGGDSALYKYLKDNVRYPMAARDQNIQGKVMLHFTINENGAIENIKAVKEVQGGCTKEAIRVVKSMPQWIPARYGNKNVAYVYELPVLFILKDG